MMTIVTHVHLREGLSPTVGVLSFSRASSGGPFSVIEKGWRATFYTGMGHSPTSATGSAWEPTPCRAVHGAARDALRSPE